jgi:hypothetical protein
MEKAKYLCAAWFAFLLGCGGGATYQGDFDAVCRGYCEKAVLCKVGVSSFNNCLLSAHCDDPGYCSNANDYWTAQARCNQYQVSQVNQCSDWDACDHAAPSCQH